MNASENKCTAIFRFMSLNVCGDSTVHKQLAEADLIVELMNVIVSIAMFEVDVMVILK